MKRSRDADVGVGPEVLRVLVIENGVDSEVVW